MLNNNDQSWKNELELLGLLEIHRQLIVGLLLSWC